MPLPSVLMTDVIRSTKQGDSHGGAYLVDLERYTHRKVLDWNTVNINWEGRGEGRGLRGIAFHRGLVYIAASDEIFVFDQGFKLLRSFKNRYLRHTHETFLDADTLYLSSTAFDSVLAMELPSGRFTKGWCIRFYPDPANPQAKKLVMHAFDPNGPDSTEGGAGPPRGDTCHINHVWKRGGDLFASGTSLERLLVIDGPARGVFAPIPTWTHNARPLDLTPWGGSGEGVIYNSTAGDRLVIADRSGRPLEAFDAVRYDPSRLTFSAVPDDHARQGFLRGLITMGDLAIAGSSPSTVSLYQHGKGPGPVRSVNVSLDVRNAPHGLAVWPF